MMDVKKVIKNMIFKSILHRKLQFDYKSDISFKTLMRLTNSKKFTFPIKVTESVIGDIEIGEGSKFYRCICSGKIKIGRFVTVYGPGTRISSRLNGVNVGSFTSIASNVIIQEHYHRYDKISTYYMSQNIFREGSFDDIYSKGKIIIEEDVWIGSNSVILSGITIGRGSIVGAGSVVTKDVPPYSIVVGNPAKVIKKRFSEEIQDYIESLRWWEWEIDKIVNNKELFKMDMNSESDIHIFEN